MAKIAKIFYANMTQQMRPKGQFPGCKHTTMCLHFIVLLTLCSLIVNQELKIRMQVQVMTMENDRDFIMIITIQRAPSRVGTWSSREEVSE